MKHRKYQEQYRHIPNRNKTVRNTFSSYLQQVCVNKLRAPHARGLVELRLKQNGNVLGGGRLLVGQAGLGLAQLWRLDTGVTV